VFLFLIFISEKMVGCARFWGGIALLVIGLIALTIAGYSAKE
jgi:hypothetical protein